MTKAERQARWERRKAQGNPRYCERGFITGNPRYSLSTGWTYDGRSHRTRAAVKRQDESQNTEA
jgi:hypothetical protein